MMYLRGQGGKGLSQCGHLSIFRDFVRTSFMDGSLLGQLAITVIGRVSIFNG